MPYNAPINDQDYDDCVTLQDVASYVSEARVLLQDLVIPYRYADAELISALNITLLEARRIRADLFVFVNKGNIQNFTVTDMGQTTAPVIPSTLVNMEPPFRNAILHGVVGHALERDQEDYQDARATAFLGIFNDMLLGRRQRAIVGGSGGRQ